MACASPPRSLASSASDYGTCGSTYCSDDDQPHVLSPYPPGICPHCHHPFQQPLTLQCGHSLCSGCVSQLLLTLNGSLPFRRCQIRMGLRSYNLQKHSFPGSVYRSPACVVCNEPPKIVPPVPNLELQLLLRSLMSSAGHPAFRDSVKRTLSSSGSKDDAFFRNCKVAILGSRGVGKSSLKRVQFGNDIVFKDILGTTKQPLMIDMADGNNCNSDMDTADGCILVYSITDRKSFLAVPEIFSSLSARRGPSVPVVLVASKSDMWHERNVTAYEGQSLARSLGCPFLEVSSKKECDSVHEAFKELARLVEIQRLEQSVV